jgi:hypothetical protein
MAITEDNDINKIEAAEQRKEQAMERTGAILFDAAIGGMMDQEQIKLKRQQTIKDEDIQDFIQASDELKRESFNFNPDDSQKVSLINRKSVSKMMEAPPGEIVASQIDDIASIRKSVVDN